MTTPSRMFDGWPDEARAVVERAAERHGGWRAWESFPGLRVQSKAFGGMVGKLKGLGKTFIMPTVFHVDPKAQRTEFLRFPNPDQITVYEGGGITILDAGRGQVIEERAAYRSTFSSLFRKLRKWSNLDIAYFIGYSMPNYHSYPFSLPMLGFVGMRSYTSEGGMWNWLTLDYPAGFDCHSRRQTFHFDPTGLLRRVDYKADIVGPGPTAAHHYENYTTVAGLMFPQRRRVLGRVFGILTSMNMVTAELELASLPAGVVAGREP